MKVTRSVLRALTEMPHAAAGPLSPLTRIAAPAGAADRDGLRGILAEIEGLGESSDWRGMIPALLDPALTLMLIFADKGTQVMGQYLWPEASGSAGYCLDVGEDLELRGPVSLEKISAGVIKVLAPGEEAQAGEGGGSREDTVAGAGGMRLMLAAGELYALAALTDAYAAAMERRRQAGLPGPPPGLAAADVAAAWKLGTSTVDPALSVSLLMLLGPEAAPPDFERQIPALIASMEAAGLLAVLESEPGAAGGIFVLGPELENLCRTLAAGALNFGLAVQRRLSAQQVEATLLAGWRTAAGIWLADVSTLPSGAELMLIDPSRFAGLLDALLNRGPEPAARPADTMPSVTPPAGEVCTSCGVRANLGDKFCSGCGAPLAPEPVRPVFCRECGEQLQPGASYCVSCGSRRR